VSYRKEHGIYARMFAFWACLLLVAYGCFHEAGLADTLKGWMGDSDTELVASFPLVKTLRVSTCIAAGFLAVMGFVIHAILNRPRVADVLIETENEMVKVTWPTWQEAWQGSVAVAVMVLVLFVFLTLTDLGLVALLQSLLGGAA